MKFSHFQHGPKRVAMLYPSPYRAGMSSLGYQWTIEILARAGFSVERVFLPDNVDEWKKKWRSPMLSCKHKPLSRTSKLWESHSPMELEMAGFMQCLDLAGIRPIRGRTHHSRSHIYIRWSIHLFEPTTIFTIR